ncbi:Prophage CP4-57 integrase [Dyella sp. AD56]|uniref:tyrosine-type recombinase/integrase n=1 Tax=Dyella sp. AD56 TaxID=1528744 RepID=UPI000C84095D|nr:integrase arm-type DNA-binding domain-containing protein [Dyella sp. AD56]PMQ03716.1 Prophage CP4-57 integrase [Dyella sp. AD56]
MLTDTTIRKTKPKATPLKLSDGGGMHLLLKPDGSRYWRLSYRFAGKQKTLALGVYPTVTLADARQRREDARRLLANGVDPGAERKARKAQLTVTIAIEADTFEKVARDWMAWRDKRGETAETTANKDRWRLESYLFPHIGLRPISEITAIELRDVLRLVEETGKRETASRTKITAGQVFRWAVLEGRTHTDLTASLRGLFTTPKPTHRAAITDPLKIGELLRSFEEFSGQFTTQCALKLAPLVFVRPGELRKAEWSEFDLENAIWRIPGERMKMKAPHVVPLSTQAIDVLRELVPLTGNGRFVFPGVRTTSRPMSENTINVALRRLGYGKEEMTGHGFRSMAASRLNEMGWNADAIERQLAHAESNKVRAAYTHAAQYLEERTRMMQAWADYLQSLKSGAQIVPFKRTA